MDRLEWQNTFRLLKVRWNGTKRFRWAVICAPIIAFVYNLISGISSLRGNSGLIANGQPVSLPQVNDPSTLFTLAIVVCAIVMVCTYRDRNLELDVFPGTNVSRSLSMYLLIMIVIVYSGFACLITNLLDYAIFSAITSSRPEFIILNPLNIGNQLSGMFLYMLFLLFNTALIMLIGALIQKFRYVALIVVIALETYLIVSIIRTIMLQDGVEKFFGAYLYIIQVLGKFRFSTFAPFMFLAIWLLILTGMLLINKHSKYSNTGRSKHHVATSTITLIVLLLAIFPVMAFWDNTYPVAKNTDTSDLMYNHISKDRIEKIVLDASGVKAGSKLSIKTTNFSRDWSDPDSNGYMENPEDTSTDNNLLGMEVYYDKEEFDHFNGKQLKISVRPPLKTVNGFDLSAASNPKVTAKLEGNTLYLDFTYTKIRPIRLPNWNFLKLNSGAAGTGMTEISVS
jgi:hypothetical protein